MPLHQQTVRIDALRRAGDERAHVFILLDTEMRGVVWQNGENVTHFVSQRPIQHMQEKPVSDLHLFEIRQHLLSGKTGMTGQNGVRPVPAHRKG